MDASSRPQVGDTWYRYEDVRHASIDDFGDAGETYVQIYQRTYKVSKVTPKGVWLSYFFIGGAGRFVRLDARKRFAHSTKEEALESFKARKAAQVRILERQLSLVRHALWQAERLEREFSSVPLPSDSSAELLTI
jgi:hypothetical protein